MNERPGETNDVAPASRTMLLAMRVWFGRTIARKLLLAFFFVFLITYLATALVVLSAVRTAVTKAELDTLAQLAHLKLNNLDIRFELLATDLRAWSKLDVMNDLASGDVDKRVERALQGMKNDYTLKGDLYAFDALGHLLASTKPQQGTITLPAIWRPHNQLSFVDKHANPFSGEDIVALSAPVTSGFSSSFQLGTLVLVYPWSEVKNALTDNSILLRRQTVPVLLESTLANVTAADLPTVLADQTGWVQIGNQSYLVNNARGNNGLISNWQVEVLRKPESLYRTLNSVALQLAALCLILALPLTLSIRWLARRLTAPLRDLTQFVAGITKTGDLSKRLALRSHDEIGTLASAFNHMAARLESASVERERFVHELEVFAEELEDKVRDRTQKLTASNAELTQALNNLKSAQSQLIHQEKMASLGQLVAGVAHELNNPIGFIYANFPHLEEYAHTLLNLLDELRNQPMPEDAKAHMDARMAEADLEFLRKDLLKIIRSGQSGATRVKEIISSLRSFSRLDEAVVKAVRLEDGLDDTLALLHHHYKNHLTIVKDYQLNVPVLCRPGQLNQVFMNIIYNAIQATPNKGTITVSTHLRGDWAVVTITDTGRGIPPEVLGRIFDPFFTTKQVGEGTGLGLSISYGIVEQHGGRIMVASEPGHGTTFTIYLPLPQNTPDATS
ncbi:MAG: ATP-binding protein [Sulfuriferula sp.]|nr:ATP-binding protein [Sulfuriferula sp.]